MTNTRLYTAILFMLYCIAGVSLSAKSAERMTLESFPLKVMQCSNGAKMVTASYTGPQGHITRSMIYNAEGLPVMHTAVYLNGNRTDTVLFDRDSRVMATMSNATQFRKISDGTISDYAKYKEAYQLIKPKRSTSVNIDDSSRTPQGDWTKASYTRGKIVRDIEYNETVEYRAALRCAQRLIEELAPEYEKRKKGHEELKSDTLLALLAFAVFGTVFMVLLFMVTRKANPSLRYLFRHLILFVFLGPMLMFVLISSALNGMPFGMMMLLFALGGGWLFYGKKYFRKMASCRELGNTYILISVILVSGSIGLITLPSIVGTLLPIPLLGTLLGYAAVVLQIVYHDPTTYRCPFCHTNDAYFEYKVTPDGRLIKVSKERSGTVSTPVLNQALNRLERETIDKKTTTTSVYQMERVHKRCSCCGYHGSYRRRGALLSQEIETNTTKTEERADLNS